MKESINLTNAQASMLKVIKSLKGRKRHLSTQEAMEALPTFTKYQAGAVISTLIEKGLIKVEDRMICSVIA